MWDNITGGDVGGFFLEKNAIFVFCFCCPNVFLAQCVFGHIFTYKNNNHNQMLQNKEPSCFRCTSCISIHCSSSWTSSVACCWRTRDWAMWRSMLPGCLLSLQTSSRYAIHSAWSQNTTLLLKKAQSHLQRLLECKQMGNLIITTLLIWVLSS